MRGDLIQCHAEQSEASRSLLCQTLNGVNLKESQKAGSNKQVALLEIEKAQHKMEHGSVALKRVNESSSGYNIAIKFIIPSYHLQPAA